MKQQVQQYLEQGFCFYDGALDAREQQQIRDALDRYRQAQNGGTEASFGFTIHPLLPSIPELAPFLAHPLIVDTMRELLDDEVRLVHAGARISNEVSPPRIPWHHHYCGFDGPSAETTLLWPESEVPGRTRPSRILAGIYVDGSNPEVGPLVALPRRIGDPIGEPRGEALQAWPGEVEVAMSPGSIAIFDTALWHAAKGGTNPGMRRLYGAHYQGWSNARAHSEDNACDVPEVQEYKARDPRLRALLERV